MSRPSYERVKLVLGEASELQGEERRSYLERACGDDVALRAEVEQLLQHGDAAEGPLDGDLVKLSSRQIAQVVKSTTSTFTERGPPLPDRIGPFRITRRIATGGMGAVYEAEQDNPVRRVALKVLRRELISPALTKRFQQETQILGLLQHSGIAQVYEAGTDQTPEGPVPYFAMEFVEGRPLGAYAADELLDESDRLKLFAQVCDAVQHAHERGVIHRDLKPDNVLVTADGQPKVLDFGVARATDADIQAVTIVTEVGQIMGTLPYMSPEQVAADPDAVDVRSDVYSLGVMLYELLCGQRPHELGRMSVPSAARVIREDTVTRLGSLDTRFRGDVETIVGMALEKDIRRRYASAAELADDIRRHLANKPIGAHPPSSFYQLTKFARRHRGLVGGVVLALVALAVGLGFAIRYGADEAIQRRAAEAAGYRAALAAASLQLDSGRSGDVVEVLDAVPEAIRGWEWHHLRSRAQPQRWAADVYDPVDTGRNPYRFRGVPVEFSRDGARVLSLVDDHTLGVWDAVTGEPKHQIDVGGAIIPGGVVSGPGGVAVLLLDGSLVMCDDEVGVVTHCEQLDLRPIAMSWDHASGRLAITCMGEGSGPDGMDAPGRLLVGPPGELAAVPALAGSILKRIAWASGGRMLLVEAMVEAETGASGGMVPLDTRAWEPVGVPTGLSRHNAARIAVSMDTDTPLVAIGTGHREVHLLTLGDSGLEKRAELRGHREISVNSTAVSRDGHLVVSAASEGTLLVWDAAAGTVLEAYELEGTPQVAISSSGRFVALNSGGRLRVWSPGTSSVQVLEGPETYVYEVAWTPDGRTLVARGFEGNLRVYDPLGGRPLAPTVGLRGVIHPSVSRSWGITADGDRALVTTRDAGVEGLDLVSGIAPFRLRSGQEAPLPLEARRSGLLAGLGLLPGNAGSLSGHQALVAARGVTLRGYLLGPGGRVGLDLRSLRLEDVATGEQIRQLTELDPWDYRDKGERWNLLDGSFSPDGSRVVVVRKRRSVLVYDCSTGELLAEMSGHTGDLYCVAWSPDGARIASGANDTTVRIWDAESFELLVILRGHDYYVKDLAWSPDGSSLASASGDGTVRLWGTDTLEHRNARIRAEQHQREAQRPWVASLFDQLDDPREVELAVRAATDLDDDQRHAALRVVRELANTWWEQRAPAATDEPDEPGGGDP